MVSRARLPAWDSRAKIVGALLVLGTFVLYAQVLGHEFIYLDDRTYVTKNPVVIHDPP